MKNLKFLHTQQNPMQIVAETGVPFKNNLQSTSKLARFQTQYDLSLVGFKPRR